MWFSQAHNVFSRFVAACVASLIAVSVSGSWFVHDIRKALAEPPISHFAFDNGFTLGDSKVAGVPFQVTIRAFDENSNIRTDFSGQVTLIDLTGSLSPTLTTSFINGVWTGMITITSSINLNTLTLTYGTLTATSANFAVVPDTRFTNIAIVSGNNQTAAAGAAAAQPLTVRVIDLYGNPIPNVAVTYAIVAFPAGATNQALSSISATSGLNGQVSSSLTLGRKAGTYIVSARTGLTNNQQVTFYANAVPGAPFEVRVTPLLTIIPKSASQQFTAEARDLYGNPITGLAVTWSVVNGGGTFSDAATGIFTAGEESGNYANTIRAQIGSIGGSASVTVINETSGSGEGNLPGNGSNGTGGTPGSPPTPTPSPTPTPTPTPDPSPTPTFGSGFGDPEAGIGDATGGSGGGKSDGEETGSGSGVTGQTSGTEPGGAQGGTTTAAPGAGSGSLTAEQKEYQEALGKLDRVYVVPSSLSIPTTTKQLVTAQAFDRFNNAITNASYQWELTGDVGVLNFTTAFATELTASVTPGNGTLKVTVKQGELTASAEVPVTITPRTGGQLVFSEISSPQKVNTNFVVTVTAQDFQGNPLAEFNGNASLTDSTGSVQPSVAGPFVSGIWRGEVRVLYGDDQVVLTAIGGGMSGSSNAFTVEGEERNFLRSVAGAFGELMDAITGKEGDQAGSAGSTAGDLIRTLGAAAAAGLALLGSAIGGGILVGRGLEAIGRNPLAKGKIIVNMYISLIASLMIAAMGVMSAIFILG
jgi:F0F1-type ATP synthase membrane subunit c/vacuolar-type H+-ATPase subunit K